MPEVETVMRGMQARLEGRVIRRAEIRRADLRWPFPPGLAARLTGARVLGFRRRAKYILMRLDGDRPDPSGRQSPAQTRGDDSVLLHLGMSGRITLRARGRNDPELHEHVVLETDDGWEVAFVDPRRFGSVDLVPTADEDRHRLLAGLGPEPLSDAFTAKFLKAALAGKRTSVKAALLDQTLVAGLGNIYVCEALFRARIAPTALAGTVPTRRLVAEIKATLNEAVAAGGSTLRDYVQPGGELGYFQHAWQVYGREGQPCPACPGPPACPGIARITQSARSTFFCPKLQR